MSISSRKQLKQPITGTKYVSHHKLQQEVELTDILTVQILAISFLASLMVNRKLKIRYVCNCKIVSWKLHDVSDGKKLAKS